MRVVEDHLDVGKRRVATGVVWISTTTEVVEEVAEVELDRYRVEVTRVPIGRVIGEAPLARSEGDTTIVPVVEERFVVVKQLFLKEKLHIRHVVERQLAREPVALRRQRVVVERSDGAGVGEMVLAQAVEDDAGMSAQRGQGRYHGYNAVLKRATGGEGRAEMTLAELEAAVSWLERNRLFDHLCLLDGDMRFAWSVRRQSRAAVGLR